MPRKNRYSMCVRYFGEGLRLVGLSHSRDFTNWTDPVSPNYRDFAPQPIYTNQIQPYYRAPHILFGFPTRYGTRPLSEHNQGLAPVDLRKKLTDAAQRVGTDLTDGLFMSSRDGTALRRWDEAFLRPGPQMDGRWIYGDNYHPYGLFETMPNVSGHSPKISMLFTEHESCDSRPDQHADSRRAVGPQSAMSAMPEFSQFVS